MDEDRIEQKIDRATASLEAKIEHVRARIHDSNNATQKGLAEIYKLINGDGPEDPGLKGLAASNRARLDLIEARHRTTFAWLSTLTAGLIIAAFKYVADLIAGMAGGKHT